MTTSSYSSQSAVVEPAGLPPLTIRYRDSANGRDAGRSCAGPALLLLHGLFDHSRTWDFITPYLAPSLRLIAPDLIGCGHSDKPLFARLPLAARYAPALHSRYLHAFIKSLGLTDLIIAGNSLGGGIALDIWLNQANLRPAIRGLVLIDAAGYPQRLNRYIRSMGSWLGYLLNLQGVVPFAQRSKLLQWGVRRGFERVFCNAQKIQASMLEASLEPLMTANAFYAHRLSARNIVPPGHEALVGRFGQIACPVLVIWGLQDRIISPLCGHRFAADIPRAQLHLIDACGHAPQLEQPQRTAALIHHWAQNALQLNLTGFVEREF